LGRSRRRLSGCSSTMSMCSSATGESSLAWGGGGRWQCCTLLLLRSHLRLELLRVSLADSSFDYDTPIEETMQALHDVVQAGYARYIGMSSCHAYQFHQMQSESGGAGCTKCSAERSSSCLHRPADTRLRHQQPSHAVHLHAELPQRRVPRGGARDGPDSQGGCQLVRAFEADSSSSARA
jgi:hypothetical protein